MKKYQGTKTVQAEPMNECEAVQKGFARPNRDGHEWRQGYHVEYPDGYNSWSPKKVFEESYRLSEDFFNRMQIEFDDLADKVKKLSAFLQTDAFASFTTTDKSLMRAQLSSMTAYREILHMRIDRHLGACERGPVKEGKGPCNSCTCK